MKQIPQSSDPGGQAAAHGASAEDLLKTIESQCFIWETVVSDPATGVALMDRDGRLLYINKQSVRFFFTDNLTPEEIIGKTIAELGFPEDWVAERLRISAEIIDSGESILLRTVWQGHQQFSWMRSIQSENPGDLGRVLVITRRVVAGEESEHLLHGEYEVIESSLIRLGKLDVLEAVGDLQAKENNEPCEVNPEHKQRQDRQRAIDRCVARRVVQIQPEPPLGKLPKSGCNERTNDTRADTHSGIGDDCVRQ